MRTSNLLRIIGAGMVATLLVAAQARATIAYDFPGTLAANEGPSFPTTLQGPLLVGTEFVVNSAINVTEVGAFVNGSSLGASVPVALYALSGTTWSLAPGASVVTFSSGTTPTIGSAAFQTISPVTLQAGGTYAIVAANYAVTGAELWNSTAPGPGSPPPTFNDGGGLIAMPSGDTWFYATGTSTLGSPLGSFTGQGSVSGEYPIFAGATFEFEPVPEVAAFGAAAVGLLGLVYIGRYALLRRRIQIA